MDSILDSVKKTLGYEPDYHDFDVDIIVYINMALATLTQLGVGKPEGFRIQSQSETWEQFVQGAENLEMVRAYVCMKVRMLFDPPSNSFVMDAYKNQCSELEWRLNVQVDRGE